MLQQTLDRELRQLDVETFEVEEINDVGIDAPVVIIDDGGGGDTGFSICSCSTSCSSCCSCSTSATCSCSTSTSN